MRIQMEETEKRDIFVDSKEHIAENYELNLKVEQNNEIVGKEINILIVSTVKQRLRSWTKGTKFRLCSYNQ